VSSLAIAGISAAINPKAVQAAPRYLGQVATRCWIPQELDRTNRQFNSRSWHFARDSISTFRIAFPNWYAIGGNTDPQGIERGPGSPAIVLASIEYPANVFTRVMWNGAPSAFVKDGETALSDPINLSIPNGSKFYVRFFVSCDAAVPFTLKGIQNAAPGDAINFASSGLVDKTMGGLIESNKGGFGFTPAAIIAQTQLPTVAILGDSIAYGSYDAFDESGDVGIVARAVGPSFAYLNLACGHDRADKFMDNHSRRVALAAYASSVVIQYGVNDLKNGRTAEQILADRSAIAGFFAGKTIIETTITPLAKSTDNFLTRSNQSLLSEAQEANRIFANAAIRGGRPGFAHFADTSNAIEEDGLFRVPQVTPDGVHLTREGYLMAAKALDPAWVK